VRDVHDCGSADTHNTRTINVCKYVYIYMYVSTFGRNNLVTFDMKYLLTGIVLTNGGSNTVHIYTQTIHKTTQ
jgi:hypothetical protein